MENVTFHLDGREVSVDTSSPMSLLDALHRLGVTSAKDGCSPQGQCGCCTVLVDGDPRVACVTPLRRVSGRFVTTFAGLGDEPVDTWSKALVGAGGSQCGFCTPGIVVRLEWLRQRGSLGDPAALDRTLAAHLCRCTGWQTIGEAASHVVDGTLAGLGGSQRDLESAARRATIEGGHRQVVGPGVVGGNGGFAADTAPPDALVALLGADGEWVVGESWAQARQLAAKVQGRHTTASCVAPIEVPEGDWAVRLQTSWVEPAYLELDASWCEPGGDPTEPLANGGAFGGKADSPLPAVARKLADRHGRAVLACWTREDVVRHGPKRPPLAAGVAADGSGIVRIARTAGVADAITAMAPRLEVVEVDVSGPPTSASIRAAGWAEAAVLVAAATGAGEIVSPSGATASAAIGADGAITVQVRCGDPLDDVVLRSYCIGAAHMAAGWVTSESIAVDEKGNVGDLTIRSFGILRAGDMPPVEVVIEADDGPPTNGSDAVFAAVALAIWRSQGLPTSWPTGVALRP
ncbi:MAG: 2Fe-2S iron-sulfur cluster binding domain-containing protein [Microthrixaceae bacterium]|nr:2Fe-2S iron-sulfur cluster binding domain-containing protein [Microthrixaceae bacterium]